MWMAPVGGAIRGDAHLHLKIAARTRPQVHLTKSRKNLCNLWTIALFLNPRSENISIKDTMYSNQLRSLTG